MKREQYPVSLALSDDGLQLAVCWTTGTTVVLWRLPQGEEIRRFVAPRGEALRGVALSPDGRLLAAGFEHERQHGLLIWDLAADRPPRTLPDAPGRVLSLSFSPDSRWVACGGEEGLLLLDRETWQARRLPGYWTTGVGFSPDSRLIASADRNGVVKVWRSDPGRELIEREYSMWAGTVSGASDMAALGSMDRKLELVDLQTGSLVRTLEPHLQVVMGIDFSPDGKLVATAGSDRCIHLW